MGALLIMIKNVNLIEFSEEQIRYTGNPTLKVLQSSY